MSLTLILGDEELLVSRAVSGLTGAARAADAEADIRELRGDEVEADGLAELLSPSLFGGTTVLVVRAAQDLDESARDLLVRYVADPMPETVLVLAHSGVTKGKKLVEAIQAAGAEVIRCPKLTKPADRLLFVQNEIRGLGRSATAGACRALVDTVGNDLRELSAAINQLVADSAGTDNIDERVVARFHRGRAETTGFQIADAAVAGNAAAALSLLRQAMGSGTADLLVVSALAVAVRDIANVRGAGSASQGMIAKQLGMPPWKVEKAQKSARGWSDAGLSTALRAVAEADLSVKGAGVSAAYALERAVLLVAGARGMNRGKEHDTEQIVLGRPQTPTGHDGNRPGRYSTTPEYSDDLMTDSALLAPKQPLLVRLLRLQHVRPTGWQRAAVGDLPILVAVLLVLADLATAWTLLVLPVVVLALVKFHDLIESRLAPVPVTRLARHPYGEHQDR